MAFYFGPRPLLSSQRMLYLFWMCATEDAWASIWTTAALDYDNNCARQFQSMTTYFKNTTTAVCKFIKTVRQTVIQLRRHQDCTNTTTFSRDKIVFKLRRWKHYSFCDALKGAISSDLTYLPYIQTEQQLNS